MKNFIKGILFISFIVPFLENILSIIAQGTEWICTKIAVWTYNLKKSIEASDNEEKSTVTAIGFHAPEDDDNDEEEE